MPVLQFSAARRKLGQFGVEEGITVAVDDGLSLVPKAIGMAQIALAELSLQGNQ